MAKTSTQSTLVPERFSTSAEIFEHECRAVVEQLNWTAQYVPQSHVSVLCAPSGWETGAVAGLAIYWPSSEGVWRTVMEFGIALLEETQELLVGALASVVLGASDDLELRVTVTPDLGAGTPVSATLSFDDSDTDEVTGTIDVSGIAAADRDCWVKVELQTVNSIQPIMLSYLRAFRLEDSPLASLPSPPDE